jgi:hypothetical protein
VATSGHRYGQFGAWLHAVFGMTDRTAQNGMRAAVAFGAKTEIVSDVPPTALDTLAAPFPSTRFRNLDQPLALARTACDPKQTWVAGSNLERATTLYRTWISCTDRGSAEMIGQSASVWIFDNSTGSFRSILRQPTLVSARLGRKSVSDSPAATTSVHRNSVTKDDSVC